MRHIGRTRAEYRIIFAVVLPNLRVANVMDRNVFVRNVNILDNGIFFGLCKVNAVLRGGKALEFDMSVTDSGFFFGRCAEVPRVHEIKLAVLFDSGAAKATAALFVRLFGLEGNGQVFPIGEVVADDVPPMHGTPLRRVGVMLIEEMILPFVKAHAVRVVTPAKRRRNVIARIPAGVRHLRKSFVVLNLF